MPQNIIGLLVILFSKAKYDGNCYVTKHRFGVSLGKYIILHENYFPCDLDHEKGHQKQSLYLGWLYLLIIGIPSSLGNLYDRIFHKKWDSEKRYKWYYNQPWEKWADKLGKVNR